MVQCRVRNLKIIGWIINTSTFSWHERTPNRRYAWTKDYPPKAEVTGPESVECRIERKRTNSGSLCNAILYLKLSNAFHLCSFVLLFLLFSILVQIPILLFLFLLLKPFGVERELWERSKKAIRFTIEGGNRNGDGSERSTEQGAKRTRSRPLIPVFFPAAWVASLAFLTASSSACFLSILVRFHLANVSGVTGVRFCPSL